MKIPTLFIATVALFAASGIAFAGDTANSSSPLNNRSEQIQLAPATHKPPGAGATANSVVGNNRVKKTPQQSHFDSSSSLLRPALPVNAGQQHVAIIGGAARKTSHESGVINGFERRRSP